MTSVERNPLLFGIKRPQEFRGHSRTLEAHLRRLLPSLEEGKKRGRKQFVFLAGAPGSGKNTVEPEIMKYLGPGVARIGFDEDGRDRAREIGLIGKTRGNLSIEEYFDRMSAPLIPTMMEAIQDPDVSTVLINAPVITGLILEGQIHGANLATDLFNMWINPQLFLQKVGSFDLFIPHDTHLIVLVADRLQREATARARDEMKNSTNLRVGRRVAERYNKPIPLTVAEWKAMQRDGARVSTIDIVRKMIDDLVYGKHGKSIRRGYSLSRENRYMAHVSIEGRRGADRLFSLPSTAFEPQLKTGENLRTNSRDIESEIKLANFIRRSLNRNPYMNPRNVFIGISNPSWDDLYNRKFSRDDDTYTD